MAQTKALSTNRKSSALWYRRGKFWGVMSVLIFAAFVGSGILLTKKYPVEDAAAGPRGEVSIATTPTGATIKVDGHEYKDKSDTKLSRPTGHYKVTLTLDGYDEQTVEIDVHEGHTADVKHVFTKNGQNVQATAPPGQSATKNYSNDQYAYTLSYPFDWQIVTDPGGTAHFYNPHIAKQLKEGDQEGSEYESLTVLAQPNASNQSAEQWYKSREEYTMEDQSQIKQRSVTFGNLVGYQYETPYGFVPYLITVFSGNGRVYLLQQKLDSPDRASYDQIVASFRLK